MSTNPDQIRRDIERTRADLSDNVNALAEEAKPSTIARRQVDKVKDGADTLKTRIFGDPGDPWDDGTVGDLKRAGGGAMTQAQHTVTDVKDRATGLADDATEAVQDVPRQVRRSTQGHPLSAGLIAFGIGALAGGLLPTSQIEQEAARTAKEKAQPLVDGASSVARDAVENIKPVLTDAATAVKDTANTAGDTIKAQAMDAKDSVSDQTTTAIHDIHADERNPL